MNMVFVRKGCNSEGRPLSPQLAWLEAEGHLLCPRVASGCTVPAGNRLGLEGTGQRDDVPGTQRQGRSPPVYYNDSLFTAWIQVAPQHVALLGKDT